jgi:site-specific DNA-cytosine methylase
VSRNPAPSREKRQAVTRAAEESVGGGKWWDGGDTSATLTTRSGGQYMPDKDNFQAVIQPTIIDRAAFNQGENAQYEPKIEESETMPSLVARGPHAVAISTKQQSLNCSDELANSVAANDYKEPQAVAQPIAVDTFNQTTNEHTSQTLGSSATDVNHYGAVINPPMAIRRLTPIECERLQGFPDNWTKIPWKKKPAEDCPDGPRYKACGNSMAVPVMRWIGQRINKKTDHL